MLMYYNIKLFNIFLNKKYFYLIFVSNLFFYYNKNDKSFNFFSKIKYCII